MSVIKSPASETENKMASDLKFEKYKYNIEFLKWLIGGVVLVLITQIIDTGFRDRAAGLQEISQYDKYVTELVVLNKDIGPRRLLAQYFSNVVASDKLREKWKDYYGEVNREYMQLLKQGSLTQKEINALEKKDTILSKAEQERLKDLKNKQSEINRQLNTELVIPNAGNVGEFLIVAASNASLDKAKDLLDKIQSNGQPGRIYRKRNVFRIVAGPYNDKGIASSVLPLIRREIGTDAYLVSSTTWCNSAANRDGYIECN